MSPAGPLDLTIAFLLAVRRFGAVRTLLGTLVLAPVFLWSLPPVSCGCLGPMFRRCARDLPYFAAMRSDLKNLASQQEIYFSDFRTYTNDAEALSFIASDGVRLTVVATPDGWAAEAEHEALGTREGCALYHGAAPVYESGLVARGRPGEVTCTSS